MLYVPPADGILIEWGLENAGIRQGASLDKESYDYGEEITLRLTITNQTDRPYQVSCLNVESFLIGISLFVVDSQGQVVPPLPPYDAISTSGWSNNRGDQCPPHGSTGWGIVLNRMFKLEPSKTYYAYAMTRTGNQINPLKLISGNVRFSIKAKGSGSKTEAGAAFSGRMDNDKSGKAALSSSSSIELNPVTPSDAASGSSNSSVDAAVLTLQPQDDHARDGHAPLPPKPFLAQFSEVTKRKVSAFATLLLCALGLLGYILFRARARAAVSKGRSSSRN